MADEIIEDVWRIKDEIAREHGYDLDRLGAYFQRREREWARQGEDAALAGGDGGAGGIGEGGLGADGISGRLRVPQVDEDEEAMR